LLKKAPTVSDWGLLIRYHTSQVLSVLERAENVAFTMNVDGGFGGYTRKPMVRISWEEKQKCMSSGEIMWEGHDLEVGARHTLLNSIVERWQITKPSSKH
jgi:hypothetical protein